MAEEVPAVPPVGNRKVGCGILGFKEKIMKKNISFVVFTVALAAGLALTGCKGQLVDLEETKSESVHNQLVLWNVCGNNRRSFCI